MKNGYENYGECGSRQMNFENSERNAEPRRREHKIEDEEYPEIDTYQKYLRLQEEEQA